MIFYTSYFYGKIYKNCPFLRCNIFGGYRDEAVSVPCRCRTAAVSRVLRYRTRYVGVNTTTCNGWRHPDND